MMGAMMAIVLWGGMAIGAAAMWLLTSGEMAADRERRRQEDARRKGLKP
jgi:hypothetical protein